MNKIDLIARLQDFIESEARSCSMDPGCITPEYVYRMWGGAVPFDEIVEAFRVHGSQDSQARMSDQRSSARLTGVESATSRHSSNKFDSAHDSIADFMVHD